MNAPRRIKLYAAAILIGLVALNAFAMIHLREAKARAIAATIAESRSGFLAAQIVRSRGTPTVAGLREMGAAELASRIEAAGKSASLLPQRIARIAPESPRRLNNTDYLEKPTQLLLKDVELPQLVRVLHQIGSGGIQVRSLRLSASQEQADEERWTAEVILSEWIYSPEPAGERGRK